MRTGTVLIRQFEMKNIERCVSAVIERVIINELSVQLDEVIDID